METTGSVVRIEPMRQGVSQRTGKQWRQLTVVLDVSDYNPDTGEKYESYLAVPFMRDEHIDKVGFLSPGDRVTIAFKVRSREVESRTGSKFWSTDINVIGVEVEERPQPSCTPQPQQTYAPQPQPQPQQRPQDVRQTNAASMGDLRAFAAQNAQQSQQGWNGNNDGGASDALPF